jgi:diguanylate cyclase (GGDEF)-like protein/PAS domain S-box-containing protein
MAHETDASPVVLVVDDDGASRALVHEALANEGFAVIEADNGEKAVSIFDVHRPDLVLMDAVMPGMDGFQACKALRGLPGGLDVPVLVLTGIEDVDAIARAFEAGATDFATKPIDWQVLAHRARYMLRAKHAFEALRRSEARLASAQLIARLGHWEHNLSTGEFHWSEQLSRIFGLPPDTVVPHLDALWEHVQADDRGLVRAARERLRDQGISRVDFRVLWPDGSVRFLHEHAEALLDEQARPARVVGTVQDVTERKEAENRARFLANYDELTGLPNRRFLAEHLGAALARAQRSNHLVATLFLDLDRFKRINDTLGHSLGDRLLQMVTERLRAGVRESDAVGRVREADEPTSRPLIARFGGDEFILVLTDLAHALDADTVARRILRTIREPLVVEGHEVVVTASIGISLFPNNGRDVDTLLRNADAAMYHAKGRGRDGHEFYDLSMNASAIEGLALEKELRRALEEEQFLLYFQPQVDSRTGHIVGAEALIRWRHPTRGLIAPEAFIPLTEETGLIVPIGEWVVRTACAEARAWNDAGWGPVRVSVNLSGRQFKQGNLRAIIERSVDAARLPPSLLELEITESVVLEEPGESIATVKALRAQGLTIAVDDFGTGYSSLSYLKRLPVDRVKIDRSFIRNVLTDPDDAALSTAIIAMAGALRLESVAEGVESQGEAEFLRSQGCQYLQGYFFSRPLSAADFTRLLRRTREGTHRDSPREAAHRDSPAGSAGQERT